MAPMMIGLESARISELMLIACGNGNIGKTILTRKNLTQIIAILASTAPTQAITMLLRKTTGCCPVWKMMVSLFGVVVFILIPPLYLRCSIAYGGSIKYTYETHSNLPTHRFSFCCDHEFKCGCEPPSRQSIAC